jgi:hypothetical protein
MNTQIEFDADNLFYGPEEDFFRNNKEQFVFNCCDTCIAVASKIKKLNIKKLNKRIRYLEEENRELRKDIQKTRNDWKEALDEIADIETVCFHDQNSLCIKKDGLAFKIRKRLIEIKLELNQKVLAAKEQAESWQEIAVKMVCFGGLKSKTKFLKKVLQEYHSLIKKYSIANAPLATSLPKEFERSFRKKC